MSTTHTHHPEHRDERQTRIDVTKDPQSLRNALDQQGLPTRGIDTSEGRNEIVRGPNGIHERSVSLINQTPPEAFTPDHAREQVRELSDDILHMIGSMRTRGRVQMGLTATATGLNVILPGIGLAGSVGSHVLGWDETKLKRQLQKSVEALCRMAAVTGVRTDKLESALDSTGNPLSKKHLGLRVRSLLTTIFFPIARGVHRLVQEGKWSDVAHEVQKIREMVSQAPAETARRAAA